MINGKRVTQSMLSGDVTITATGATVKPYTIKPDQWRYGADAAEADVEFVNDAAKESTITGYTASDDGGVLWDSQFSESAVLRNKGDTLKLVIVFNYFK